METITIESSGPRTSTTSSYDVSIPGNPIVVTMTTDLMTALDWAHARMREFGRADVPAGVVVQEGVEMQEGIGKITYPVVIVCIGNSCLVLRLVRYTIPFPRTLLVFLRDVCTCFGWETDTTSLMALRWPRPKLSFGRLTDVRTIIAPPYHVDQRRNVRIFCSFVLGCEVPLRIRGKWRPYEDYIKRSVIEAFVFKKYGTENQSPQTPSPPLALRSIYPQITLIETVPEFDEGWYPVFFGESRDTNWKIKRFQIMISGDRAISVTLTKDPWHFAAWLRNIGMRQPTPDLLGMDIAQARYWNRPMSIALINGTDCMILDLRYVIIDNHLFSRLNVYCPVVGWEINQIATVRSALYGRLVFDIEKEYPDSKGYEDFAKSVLGYEMGHFSLFSYEFNPDPPDEQRIMRQAVQAYVCLTGGLELGYDWRNEY